MIYLSRLELNTDQEEARRWIRDRYYIHQRLLDAWEDGQAGRVLYRLETDRQPPRVIVQSTGPADWERCLRGKPALLSAPAQKGLELALHPGQRLRFLLRANPTVRRGPLRERGDGGDSEERTRVGLLREEE